MPHGRDDISVHCQFSPFSHSGVPLRANAAHSVLLVCNVWSWPLIKTNQFIYVHDCTKVVNLAKLSQVICNQLLVYHRPTAWKHNLNYSEYSQSCAYWAFEKPRYLRKSFRFIGNFNVRRLDTKYWPRNSRYLTHPLPCHIIYSHVQTTAHSYTL